VFYFLGVNSVHQNPLPNYDPLIKLESVERELEKYFQPVPHRLTIYGWLEDGTLVGEQIGRGKNWYVYESSFTKFIHALVARRQQKLAA